LALADDPNDEAIHAARKSLRKVQAIWSVLDVAGAGHLKQGRERLRSVTKTLSPIRDVAVLPKTLAKFRTLYPEFFSDYHYARVRRQLLTQHKDTHTAAADRRLWKHIGGALRELRQDVQSLRTDVRGRRALRKGIEALHRCARRDFERVRRHQRLRDFHSLRKSAKRLLHLLSLIEWAGHAVHRDIKALGRAEEWIGDAHDLAILCNELSTAPDLFASDVERVQFRRAVADMQVEWQLKAIAAAQRIFRKKPRRYANAITKAWVDARRRGHAANPRTAAAAA